MTKAHCQSATGAAALAVLVLAAGRASADTPVPRPDPFVSAADWGSTPDPIGEDRRHTPRFVTLHHAGVNWTADRDPAQFLRNLQSWGKRRPELEPPPRDTYWPDLPYHFLIAPDGRVFEGRPIGYEPESNTRYPLSGHLGVELMGNFETQRPRKRQVESAVRTVAWLIAEHDLSLDAIGTHAEVADGQTSCPGRDFSRYFRGDPWPFRTWVSRALRGDPLEIDLGPPQDGGPTDLVPLPTPGG